MMHRLLPAGLLALSFAATGLHAQTAPPAAAQPAANAVDAQAVQALKDMGAYLQSLKRFQVSTQLTGERVLADGQKLQHTAAAVMDVERPDRLRAVMTSPRSTRQLIADGKTVTLFTPAQKYYSTIEFAGTLAQLVTQLEERYAVQVPLSDLFLWGTPAAPLEGLESAMLAGQDRIGAELCDHYAFRQGMLDWQIWIAAGPRPLPRKLVITNRGDEARPQSVSLIDWNLQPAFTAASFRFTPPKGATRIDVLPRKTK